jgi:hypothetical protein
MLRKSILGLWLGMAAVLAAKETLVLELRPMRRRVLSEQGFIVKRDVQVRVKGVGAVYREDPVAYAWIFDTENRSVVWNMAETRMRRGTRSVERTADDNVRLSKGAYKLYFATAPEKGWGFGKSQSRGFWDDIFGDEERRWAKGMEDWGVEIWADESEQSAVESAPAEESNGALVSLAPLGNEETEQKHLTLTRETTIRIYAVGEGVDGEMADYGWIVRDDTGDEIWTMEYEDTEWAGGAEKNKKVDRVLTLPPGDYTVNFTTDDSHAYGEWNALPPYDPGHWGLTIWAPGHAANGGITTDRIATDGTAIDQAAAGRDDENPFILKPKKSEGDQSVLVNLTRIGDDRLEHSGFTLDEPAPVRITCLGELGHGDRFADYGWIINSRTRETVWEMTRDNTRHAGGAKKNRIFNGIVRLQPGSYIVYYITDDSHAYRDWNAGPPRDPEAWGITVRADGEGQPSEKARLYDEEDASDVLAECIRLGDDEDVDRPFELRETSKVRIYAIGEGKDGRMFDYGWIENENGKKVWRMRYDGTRHAGGADKNRMVNEVATLPAGDYRVCFRTDDSHAYDDWNADPPRDPIHWGISVRLEK